VRAGAEGLILTCPLVNRSCLRNGADIQRKSLKSGAAFC